MSKKRPNYQPPAAQAMQPPARQPPPKPKRSASGLPWHAVWRWLVSLLVIAHLAAVVSAPWNLSTGDALPPGETKVPERSSPLWQEPPVTRAVHRFFRHYLNLIYMNHGYEFFAPDPGGTHLISYRVAKQDGPPVEGRFPDLEAQWPRLLYHRHMMLAEQTQMMGRASGQSYADHLATLHGGPSRIDWMIHMLLSPQQVKDGTPLDDRSTYQVIESLEGRPRGAARGEGPIAIPGDGR
ncbi:MAG: hypothetical protein IH898_13780 [Planctomycetes bacterium]|nr:hypothetical protein [Planctomycetota bacterium]